MPDPNAAKGPTELEPAQLGIKNFSKLKDDLYERSPESCQRVAEKVAQLLAEEISMWPEEAVRLWWSVSEDALDKLLGEDWYKDDSHDGKVEWFYENVEGPVKELLCETYGHEPIIDDCGKPEHDYCARCGKSLPDQAKRKY